jgi:serine/threonine-protein kinase
MIGAVIDHYRILELVGRGAMGIVYKALDLNLDRQVAIKVMSAEARNDPDFVERFRQEARMQAALNHPNVALLFDYFVHDGAPVAVMELIDGESLEQLIRRRGPIPAHEAIPIFKQALRGVAAAHRAGIIHRDLKTANLMITRDGVVKVMDFGIAKRQSATGATKASTSVGSPLYMAPEQILGRAVDCRTDVYALGTSLYQLLSGQPPFNPRGKTEFSVLSAHVNDLPEPPTIHFRDIPPPIVDAVMRALAKEPEARFQGVDDFMHALPDVTPPDVAAPQVVPAGTPAIPRLGPTGTVAIPRVGPTGTVVIPRVGPTGTVAIPRVGPTGTVAIEYAAPVSEDPVSAAKSNGTIAFDVFGGTTATAKLGDNTPPLSPAPPPTVQSLRVTPPGFMERLRRHRSAFVAVLVATLVLGTLAHHAKQTQKRLRDTALASSGPRSTPALVSVEPDVPSPAAQDSWDDAPAVPPADTTTAAAETAAPETAMAATAPPSASTPTPGRPNLAGTWRGSYIDASGKQLLRVVSLSISHVEDDGGIEGTLQYEAASGDGECKLHPRGSTYSAGQQRLQLSPEGCSPHYPKELGVPLDFDAVNPQANSLNNGRIEAPTGEMISVKLKRVSGI